MAGFAAVDLCEYRSAAQQICLIMIVCFRFNFVLALSLVSASALSATTHDATELNVKYHDVQKCTERTLGKQWEARYGIEMALNRWGAIEATGASIDTAPQVVRVTDLRCRYQSDLAGEPRP
ncbi:MULTISPECIES: hypothetical protein [unclassified Variovorax]|uniref:hypothetical protein n=1 Tax=unclassified Variovorax TaxID=663243 RepID=UPI002B23BE49|nr:MULTISPECIES: hypothetical protein [unclassified Variovorax]MEB0057589.1 hypothetical protein [Variovorax sp. LG9.2]MEB0114145.1 hypothetical protein [Variovorax sp. RTB1]